MEGKIIVKTDIDKLIDVIRERKKVRLTNIVKEMGLSKEQIEEWIDILEKKDVINTYSINDLEKFLGGFKC